MQRHRLDQAEIRIWSPGDDPDVDEPVFEIPLVALDHGNIQALRPAPRSTALSRATGELAAPPCGSHPIGRRGGLALHTHDDDIGSTADAVTAL